MYYCRTDDIKRMIILIISLLYLITATASANDAISPDYNKFKDHLMIFAILITTIFIFGKTSAKYSNHFIEKYGIKSILNSNIAEYSLRICISTTAFYIIGFGLFTNNFWNRELLIESIIICLFVFLIDTLLIRPLKTINNYINPHKSFFCHNYNNNSIKYGILILLILLTNYAMAYN